MDRIVIALGGNALLQKSDIASFETQVGRAIEAFRSLSSAISENQVVITHGNGPQVGNILLQNEHSKEVAHPMPLHACGSMSQGLIGEVLSMAYDRVKYEQGLSKEISVIMTRTVVREDDPAFSNPSKPIGPFYTKEQAESLMKTDSWAMKEDSGRGWRRLVASPQPVEIVERGTLLHLLSDGFLPVGVGGGGIPVFRKNGFYEGAEAVIDKDLASSALATSIEAEKLLILTDVENAYINFGKEDQKAIHDVSYPEMKDYYDSGYFASGSMGPKIRAALNFIEKGGRTAAITSLPNASKAIKENFGTIIHRN